jgi:hypothetical protein
VIGFRRLVVQDDDLGSPPPAVASDIRAGADYQSVQPGIEPLDVAQRRQVAPGADECFLGGILREFGVAQDHSSDAVQPIDGVAGQDTEGLAVSTSCTVNELRLHASLPLGGGRSGRLNRNGALQASAVQFAVSSAR